MVSKIKEAIQDNLVKRRYRWYQEQIQKQTLTYDEWIREKEAQEDETLRAEHRVEHAEVISYDECRADFDVRRYAHGATPTDVLIFHAPDASPDTRGISHVLSWFEAHPETVIAYADEDEIDVAGKRKNPWLKPDWSPDTLMSCFYFGGFFAVRRQAMENCPWLADENPLRNLYDLVLRLTEIENGTAHIDSVLFHHEKIEVWGMEETYDDLKKAAYVRRGWPLTPSGKVSIIIPTKDHPHILSNCIHSVLESGNYRDFEIIVVDNGSNEQNRARIERMRDMLKEDFRFVYHYEPMEFNFSKMCNLGVSLATGDYILLLNDDIEITQDNWLEKLMEKAVLPHVGAVGAKLYYPDDTIQHAGVLMGINGSAGHSHKSYPRTAVGDMYRLVTTQNYMAVTGACLMTKASLYRAFGGLDEEKFAVAYNDVDYCLKLWQKGLLNVYTPRAEAYHYESKSRGLDTLSENAKRYEREKANFYAKYQQYIDNYDPYYNPHFNNLFENFGLK